MGFLGKTMGKAILKKAGDITMNGVVSHIESTRSVDALVHNSKSKYKLIVKLKSFSFKRRFIVVDEFENKKYIVKMDALTLGRPSIRLYDLGNNEIGSVQAEKIYSTMRSTVTYSLYLDGEKFGTINRKRSVKIKLDLDFNGWSLDGNLMQNDFIVYDRAKNLIMQIHDAFSGTDTYILELNNRENEIMGLLLLMAIEIVLHGDH